jgi:hypothetical protein
VPVTPGPALHQGPGIQLPDSFASDTEFLPDLLQCDTIGPELLQIRVVGDLTWQAAVDGHRGDIKESRIKGGTPATRLYNKLKYQVVRAPCKGSVSQWVRIPPGNFCSNRKQSELL